MADPTRELKATWPYTSWKTILNLFLKMQEAEGLPPQVDRSYLGGSEGQKTQVLAALKFLGLVGDNGSVTPLLEKVVENDTGRPAVIRKLLAEKYPEATRLAGINATSKQLEEAFVPFGGDTLRKAVTFYLHAAKYSGHPISPNFKVPSGFSARPRGARKSKATESETHVITHTLPASDPTERYLNLLMDKAQSADGKLDTDLLDRIEALLGIMGKKPRGAPGA